VCFHDFFTPYTVLLSKVTNIFNTGNRRANIDSPPVQPSRLPYIDEFLCHMPQQFKAYHNDPKIIDIKKPQPLKMTEAFNLKQ